jgi:hypothetical protein
MNIKDDDCVSAVALVVESEQDGAPAEGEVEPEQLPEVSGDGAGG